VAIHPSSALDHKPDWVIYNEFVLTKKNYIRNITEIRPEYFFEINPTYFNPKEIKHLDTRRDLEKIEREFVEAHSSNY
jgi:pre-mRNA-splicing factor ATP-dependent RNA helicase DHX15/PRP43